MKHFSNLCLPAKVYFGIAVLGTIMALLKGAPIMWGVWKMVFAFIWTVVLGFLCDKGFHNVSWFLVLLPYIFIGLAGLKIYNMTPAQRQMLRTIQLQGAFGQEAMTTHKKKPMGVAASSSPV